MKFILSSLKLLKAVQSLSGVINSNNTLPILDDFLFNISENELRITASDLEHFIFIYYYSIISLSFSLDT